MIMKQHLLKNTYAAIVALFIAMMALPTTAQAQTKYNLKICGTQVTSDNCGDLSVIDGVEGTVKYDPDNETLTLDNATIKTSKNSAISINQEMEIKVVGKCKIDAGDRTAIYSTKGLYIYSERNELDDQCLDVVSGDCAIFINHSDLIIENCTVNTKGTGASGVGIAGNHDDDKARLKVRGKYTRVTAEGKEASICDIVEFLLTDCDITQPKRAKYDKKLKGVALDGKLVKTKVVIESVHMYGLWIAGRPVHPGNYDDLTVIDGVKGTVSYDPDTKTLTLNGATISASESSGIANDIDGLTIRLIGDNTITSEGYAGMYHVSNGALTLISSDGGWLRVKGGSGIVNKGLDTEGTITVTGCALEVTGKYYGLYGGKWEFDHCTIRVKRTHDVCGEHEGSICYLKEIPKFTGCRITSPDGAYWKKHQGINFTIGYCLFGMDDKIISDWVTIADPTGINTPTIDTAAKQGIYTLSGVKLDGEVKDLPKGVYIVNGKKVVK